MTTKIRIGISLLLVSALSLAAPSDHGPKPPVLPLRLPGGKTFPSSKRSLIRLRDEADARTRAQMRTHAWDLFAGLTGEDPVWNTWYTKCDLNLEKCGSANVESGRGAHRILGSFEVPVQNLEELSLALDSAGQEPPGAAFHSESIQNVLLKLAQNFRDHPQFASVLYNKEAANRIQDSCLYPRTADTDKKVSKPCPRLPAAPGKVPDFSRGSVVLKTVWESVVVGPDSTGKLTTWKPDVWSRIQKAGDSDLNRFKVSTVKIDTASRLPCQDRDYGDNELVPLSCFYAFQLTQEDIDTLVKAPPDFAAIRDSGVIAGNYVVLVAMHVTTKEIPEWVWATFWWDNHGASDSFTAGRPASIQPKWRHFLMDTTLSGMTPTENDGGPKICFNPYLETGITNGAISNCLQCHDKAAYGPKPEIDPYDLGILGRDGKTLASGTTYDDSKYFSNRVRTDFLWSVADALDPKIRSLRSMFQQELHELQLQELRLVK